MASKQPLNLRSQLFLTTLYGKPAQERDRVAVYMEVFACANPVTADNSSRRLLKDPRCLPFIEQAEADAEFARSITPDEVRKEITLIAKADPRDLFEYYRGACRYCHGIGHQRQRTPQELRNALGEYLVEHKRDDPACLHFDHAGGVGFNAKRAPHPDCPECFGDGEGYELLKDSRTWPDAAARLFSGLHRTKDGIKITTRNQDGILRLAASMNGLLRGDVGDPADNLPPAANVQYEAQDGRKRKK